MQIKVGFRKKRIGISAKRVSMLGASIGLMFRTKNTENLLFDLPGRWGIHSFFVFFPFLALWLDEKNRVLELKVVKPFTFHAMPKKRFAKLVEIPINMGNRQLVSDFTTTEKGLYILQNKNS